MTLLLQYQKEETDQFARESARKQAREATERKAREAAEREAREATERKTREATERETREVERKAREATEREARETAEREAREVERKARETEREAREAKKQKEDTERQANNVTEWKKDNVVVTPERPRISTTSNSYYPSPLPSPAPSKFSLFDASESDEDPLKTPQDRELRRKERISKFSEEKDKKRQEFERRIEELEREKRDRQLQEERDEAMLEVWDDCILSEQEKTEIAEFIHLIFRANPVPLDYVTALFINNLSIKTMLDWTDPLMELREIGITDATLISAIDRGLEIRRMEKIKRDKQFLSFYLSIIRGVIVINPQLSSWGQKFCVRCDVRQERNNQQKINRWRTKYDNSLTPEWEMENKKGMEMIVPEGWSVWMEVCRISWTNSVELVAETWWSWEQLQRHSNGTHWLTLKFLEEAPDGHEGHIGHNSGEIQVCVNSFKLKPLPWKPDILGEGFESLKIQLLPTVNLVPITATLVRHNPRDRPDRGTSAVLYLHDFNDYFWQKDTAEIFSEKGFRFYALDLRKYGRSLQEIARPTWIKHFSEYFEEIHSAISLILRHEGAQKILLCGLGIGGLIATLFAVDHPTIISGLLLISPQFSFTKNWKTLIERGKNWLGQVDPTHKDSKFSLLYHQSLHNSQKGQWEWDLHMKPINGFPVYTSWAIGVQEALERLFSEGKPLRLTCPVMVVCAAMSYEGTTWSERVEVSDVMCLVEGLGKVVTLLGECVRVQRVRNAVHDVWHSGLREVREEAYKFVFEFFKWMVVPDTPLPEKGVSLTGILV